MSSLSMERPVRIYLDTCVYNRPFDDQTQPRIWLETLALSVIMQMIAEAAGTDYSITSDDRLVRRYRRHGRSLQICDPIDFVRAITVE